MGILGGTAAFMLCALWGISKGAMLSMREEIMRCFSMDMEALAAEMEYRPRNIRDTVEKLQGRRLWGFWSRLCDEIADSQGAEPAWRRAAEEYDGFKVLSDQEMQLIAEAGRAIGQRSMESSIKAMRRCADEAEERARELQKLSMKMGTVYRKLGLLGGLAALLLIA